MKRTYTLILCLFILTTLKAVAQDYVLLPENFFLQKGDKLDLHLITTNQLIKQDELNYESSKTAKFIDYAGSKKMDLATLAKENASPILSVPLANDGLNMISMARKPIVDDIES